VSNLKVEDAFPPGHPARHDYKPDSPEALEWRRKNVHPLGERDFPVDHPKACDSAGSTNHLEWLPGVDPLHPELEAHTGRDAATAARMQALNAELAAQATESPIAEPREAPEPPKPGSAALPSGQPGQ